MTSAPMKDVKAALVASSWDVDEAQKELRRKGVVLASKKSSRTAAEGFLALAQNENKAAIIELNCETDFVARNDIFQHLALSLAKLALLSNGPSVPDSTVSPIQTELMEDLKTILMNLSKEVGSPVKVKDFFRMEVGEGIQSQEASSAPEAAAEAV
ncbi:unnamed protein product [Rhodiola kirilowii]